MAGILPIPCLERPLFPFIGQAGGKEDKRPLIAGNSASKINELIITNNTKEENLHHR